MEGRTYHLATRPSFGAALDAVTAVAAVAAAPAAIKGTAARDALKAGAGCWVAVATKRRAIVVGARGNMMCTEGRCVIV